MCRPLPHQRKLIPLKYFCNTKIAGLGEILSSEIFMFTAYEVHMYMYMYMLIVQRAILKNLNLTFFQQSTFCNYLKHVLLL